MTYEIIPIVLCNRKGALVLWPLSKVLSENAVNIFNQSVREKKYFFVMVLAKPLGRKTAKTEIEPEAAANPLFHKHRTNKFFPYIRATYSFYLGPEH